MFLPSLSAISLALLAAHLGAQGCFAIRRWVRHTNRGETIAPEYTQAFLVSEDIPVLCSAP